MVRVTNIAGAILAGGKNSRMSGLNKAFIRLNGTSLIQKTLRLFEKIFDEIIIVTNCPQDFAPYKKDVTLITDTIKGIGPLGGIHAALSATSKKAVFFVACDMPFLHNALIRRQIKCFSKVEGDCLLPRLNSFAEPLHAIYKKTLKENINNFVKDSSNYSIRKFLGTVNVHYWDLEKNRFNQKIFANFNTKKDVIKAKACLPAGRKHYEGKIKSLA
jgi:molybdopterin-guanine dinucleotide biosynthesis protein A